MHKLVIVLSRLSLAHAPSFYLFTWTLTYSSVIKILLIRAGLETNPGPVSPPRFTFGTWNLDSLLARDGSKLAAIESLDSIHHFDVLGVCESYLNDSIPNSDIELAGFSPEPLRADCSDQSGRPKGGVCLYYKDHIPLKHRPDLQLLEECIVAEITVKHKKFFYILAYRSPNQSRDTFKVFMQKLKDIIEKISAENPFSIILTGDLNARSPVFWDDEGTETFEGKEISNLTLLNGLQQIINEPTHFPRESIATCIDHIFTNQRDTIIDSGAIPSPDPCCKHSIVYGKINMNVPPPPPYKRKIWDYNKANVSQIKIDLSQANWGLLLQNKTANHMVEIFQSKFLAIMEDHIPNKTITIDSNYAPWITPSVKTALRRNHRVFKKWVKRGKIATEKDRVNQIQSETNSIISNAKSKYTNDLGDKICNSNSGTKCFWSAFKTLLNKKKISNIPPLIENNTYITNFKEKTKVFNKFFALQCRPLDIPSFLPTFHSLTNNCLDSITFTITDIVSIIEKLDSKKAHGFDGISISMIKICPSEVSFPLSLIFKKCFESGSFPSEWKKANVQPIHKKNSRQSKSNYRPISLLPIFSKILEKLIFDKMYSFFTENDLLSKNQSGFRPGDSTINQLLAITTEIYKAFDKYQETRAVFLDISKAFDKVWHDGLCFKLKQNGIGGNLLNMLKDFLSNRKQRVVLNGVESDWENIYAGVPQGSVLGPLLFLIYINDLTENISANMKLFADDSSLFIKVRNIEEAQNILMTDLEKITQWANQWKMQFNPDITKQAIEIVFSSKYNKPNHPLLTFNGIPVARSDSTEHLGMHLDEKLSFKKHISEAIIKAKKGISLLKFLSKYLTRQKLDLAYKMHVRPHLEYGDVIFHERSSDLMNLLENVQKQAALIVAGCWQGTNILKLYKELGWESLSERRKFHRLTLYYKILNKKTPQYLSDLVLHSTPNGTNRYMNTFFPYCFTQWQDISINVKLSPSLEKFKYNYIKIMRPPKTKLFGINDRQGLRLLTRLRVDFSDLRQHRYNHHFNCLNPSCKCLTENETSEHFLTRCPRFSLHRLTLFSNIATVAPDIILLTDDQLSSILLFGSPTFNDITNKIILTSTIHFIKITGRFNNIEAYTQ